MNPFHAKRYGSVLPMMLLVALVSAIQATDPGTVTHSAQEDGRYNRLVHEKSPYLRQHKESPIWWYAWGEEAFRAARAENKLIFVSVGYSSCHWCHVMAADSFSDGEVAEAMNSQIVAILVDREERPDVDLAYAEVLQTMIGRSGWPMSIFLMPDGTPFMGATFIPKKRFLRLLRQFQDVWTTDRDRIREIGGRVAAAIRSAAARGFTEADVPDLDALRAFFVQAADFFDPDHGGFGAAPKFLPPLRISLLMRIHKRTGSAEPLRMALDTLDAMARGGIYDQLGGGFHRYAIDREWRIPHFEKMLAENALLAVAYQEGFQLTGKAEYAAVARGVLDYLLDDMAHPKGGFYASRDADSERTEGKYYAWSDDELRAVLTPGEYRRIAEIYHVSPEGNFNPWLKDVEENSAFDVVRRGNIFYLEPGQPLPSGADALFRGAREKLLRVRSRRVAPARDEKIITAWNGLAISALAGGYRMFGDDRYLHAARGAARFILRELRSDGGGLYRRWIGGEVKHPGYLNDYAFLVQALLELYQSDFDPRWIREALALQDVQNRLFWDDLAGSYNFAASAGGPILPARKVFIDDSVPSGNAVSALNLLQLADLTLEQSMKERAARILAAGGAHLRENPLRYPRMLMALDYLLDRSKEIAIVGDLDAPETKAVLEIVRRDFLPNKVVAAGSPAPDRESGAAAVPLLQGKPLLHGKTTIYVCENNICRLPTNDPDLVMTLLREDEPYRLDGAER